MKKFEDHTFVVCAYKESQFLEEAIKSLINQTMKSNIVISTSTPNDYIKNIAEKYKLKLYINNGENGIGPDWNYAVSVAKTKYVTLAHQDDIYSEKYLEEIYNYINKNKDIIMLFTNHKEIRNGKIVKKNLNLKIKVIMTFPIRIFKKSKFIKKLILHFGNPISCPSVCLNTEIVGNRPFREDMNSNIDWGTWLDFANKKGSFIYLNEILTFHRVHSESATTKCIDSNKRVQEDYEMFCRMWPKWFAKFIMIFYKHAQDANLKG